MKKDIVYIDGAKFETIIRDAGLELLPQAGYFKVSGPKGRNLYVAKAKSVGVVHLSGFEFPEGTIPRPGGTAGAVSQWLDMGTSLTEDQILANFKNIVEHMKTLAPREPEKKVAPGKVAAPKAKGWSDEALRLPVSALEGDAKEKRMALIAKVRAEKAASSASQLSA